MVFTAASTACSMTTPPWRSRWGVLYSCIRFFRSKTRYFSSRCHHFTFPLISSELVSGDPHVTGLIVSPRRLGCPRWTSASGSFLRIWVLTPAPLPPLSTDSPVLKWCEPLLLSPVVGIFRRSSDKLGIVCSNGVVNVRFKTFIVRPRCTFHIFVPRSTNSSKVLATKRATALIFYSRMILFCSRRWGGKKSQLVLSNHIPSGRQILCA